MLATWVPCPGEGGGSQSSASGDAGAPPTKSPTQSARPPKDRCVLRTPVSMTYAWTPRPPAVAKGPPIRTRFQGPCSSIHAETEPPMNTCRPCLAEFIGTFYLCFAGIGAILCNTPAVGLTTGLVRIASPHGPLLRPRQPVLPPSGRRTA